LKHVYTDNKYEGSWGHRLKLAEYGINMWLENPIIGRGIVDPVDKMREIKKINPNDFIDPTIHFHNQHILILVQVGLFGYALFLSFFYYFYTLKIKDTEINLLKQTTLLVYFLIMFGEHYLHMIYTSTFFALLIGLFFAYKNQEAMKI
jgi:O-antigen ligase